MVSWFQFFLSWWGVLILSALDASLFFFVPLGNDALVIYMAAATRDRVWLYPLLATAGSTAGAATTYWIGWKLGEAGLPRILSARHLQRMRARVRDAGAVALALPAILPPPFPLTPFVATCGALGVNAWRFFLLFAGVRILRFGAESLLTLKYGDGVLRMLRSETFRLVIAAFVVVTIAGTVASIVTVWRRTARQPA
jgi:membrane protein YqaA with SNARE-associated domain